MASDRLARLQLSFSVYLVGYDVNISASALLNTNPGLELSLDTRAGARLLLTDLTMLNPSLQEAVWTRFQVELQTKVREDFTIEIILRHYAKQDLKLGHRHKDHN